MKRCVTTVLAAILPMATTALAHHSHTSFDLERVIAFEGAVVRYEWTNPHVYLTVEDEHGAEWLIETDPTPVMSRSGWGRDSFAPGDSVAVRAHPDRRPNVTHGLLLSIAGSDGVAMASWNSTTQDTHDGPVATASSLQGVWQGERSSLKNFVIHMCGAAADSEGRRRKGSLRPATEPDARMHHLADTVHPVVLSVPERDGVQRQCHPIQE